MVIRFSGSMQGVRFYQVIVEGDDIFMGTLGECKTFISIHNEKVLAREEMQRQARAAS